MNTTINEFTSQFSHANSTLHTKTLCTRKNSFALKKDCRRKQPYTNTNTQLLQGNEPRNCQNFKKMLGKHLTLRFNEV